MIIAMELDLREWVLDEENDFVFRQSTTSNMDLCGGRGVGTLPDAVQIPPSEAMFGGTGIHFVIETLTDQLLAGVGGELRTDWLLDHLSRMAEEEGFDLRSRFTNQTALAEWVIHVRDMGYAWLEQWGTPNWHLLEQAIVREDKLYRPLGYDSKGKTRIWLSGHPDLALDDEITDWKTSSRNWQAGKAQGAVQDDIYAALVDWNFGTDIRKGRFVVGDRAKGVWVEHFTNITPASKEAAIQRAWIHADSLINETWSYTPTNTFGKRGWHCKPQYCSQWDACPFKALGDEWDDMPQETRVIWG